MPRSCDNGRLVQADRGRHSAPEFRNRNARSSRRHGSGAWFLTPGPTAAALQSDIDAGAPTLSGRRHACCAKWAEMSEHTNASRRPLPASRLRYRSVNFCTSSAVLDAGKGRQLSWVYPPHFCTSPPKGLMAHCDLVDQPRAAEHDADPHIVGRTRQTSEGCHRSHPGWQPAVQAVGLFPLQFWSFQTERPAMRRGRRHARIVGRPVRTRCLEKRGAHPSLPPLWHHSRRAAPGQLIVRHDRQGGARPRPRAKAAPPDSAPARRVSPHLLLDSTRAAWPPALS
jgi:hypothetical protein